MKAILILFVLSFSIGSFSQTRTTKEVHDHHHKALLNKDLVEIMKDYDENSILVTPDGKVQTGLTEIRNTFEYAFREMFPPKFEIEVLQKIIKEDMVFLIYQASHPESGEIFWDFAVDTFIIEEGIIKYQTVAMEMPSPSPPENED